MCEHTSIPKGLQPRTIVKAMVYVSVTVIVIVKVIIGVAGNTDLTHVQRLRLVAQISYRIEWNQGLIIKQLLTNLKVS